MSDKDRHGCCSGHCLPSDDGWPAMLIMSMPLWAAAIIAVMWAVRAWLGCA